MVRFDQIGKCGKFLEGQGFSPAVQLNTGSFYFFYIHLIGLVQTFQIVPEHLSLMKKGHVHHMVERFKVIDGHRRVRQGREADDRLLHLGRRIERIPAHFQ